MKFKTNVPILKTSDSSIQKVYEAAVNNLVKINTVNCSFDIYNKTGLMDLGTPFIIRAGGHYQQPWTRDAALNSMNCASIIEPDVAGNTLLSVCEKDDNGKLRVLYESRNFWDKVIWIIAAYNHYLINLDCDFLKNAYEISKNTMSYYENNHYSKKYGLFKGGSFFNDGITGYPFDLHDSESKDGNVSTHKAANEIMCLSTNCIYYAAYITLAKMARFFEDKTTADEYNLKADNIKHSINKYMWNVKKGMYSYILYPDGRADNSQEGAGNLFAVLFEICDDERARMILDSLKTEKYGMPSIYEPFKGFSSYDKPARHNNLVWPHINSLYVTAASKVKRADLSETELIKITSLFVGSDYNFYEIYNPYDGSVDGGWQLSRHWDSCFDQTWCATGYVASIIYGVFGLRTGGDELIFNPCVPKAMCDSSISNLIIGNNNVNIKIYGWGSKVVKILLNGEKVSGNCVSRTIEKQNIEIYMEN